VGKRDL